LLHDAQVDREAHAMFIRVNHDGFGGGLLGAPPASFKIGGLPVGEGDAEHLLTILGGPSPFRSFLARAMAQTTLTKPFFRVVTSVGQVPKHLRRLFTDSEGRMVGGTIDRWTRTVYVMQAPGLREATRLEYAIHEFVHLFAHPQTTTEQQCPPPCVGTFQRTFGFGFGEGLTQVITEDLMEAQGISRYRDRPYEDFVTVVREVIKVFGRDALARAYFFGEVQSLRASMEARWGMNWRAIAIYTTKGDKKRALTQIQQLEEAHRQKEEAARKKAEAARKKEEADRKRMEDLLRNSPRGGFPTPSRERPFA
jgi:hypothetical protein